MLAFVPPEAGHVTITVVLAAFLRVPCRRVAVTPSLVIHCRHNARSITAKLLSIAVHQGCTCSPLLSRSLCPLLSIAVVEPSRHPLRLSRHRTIHCHHDATSVTVKWPSIAIHRLSSQSIPKLLASCPRAVHCCPLWSSLSPLSRHRAIHYHPPSIAVLSCHCPVHC